VDINLHGFEKVYRVNKSILVKFHIDVWLLLGIIALMLLSSFVVYSASAGDSDVLIRHSIRLAVGFIIMVFFAQIPPAYLKIVTPWLFMVTFALLIAVILFGQTGKGAQRWLDLGFIRFQPSEFMKLALPMMIAWIFRDEEGLPTLKHMLLGLMLVILSAGLIIIQPDLGTSILIAMSGLFVLFFAGLSWKVIVAALGLVAASLPILWIYYMHDYQKQRVMTFLNPESDPLGAGYHIIQSKISIGSGGIYGKGFLGSTQAHLDFLPESTTDFIFAVYAEEFGLIGVISLLILYLLIMLRGFYIAYNAQENYTSLLAASLIMTLFTYIFVNIGMVSGLLPVVGLPLPLISYGGSALITLMISFGILMSIHTHKSMLKT
jgi:rod shape determining protein RodA